MVTRQSSRWSPNTEITCTTPAGIAGDSYGIEVTTLGGTAVAPLHDLFTYFGEPMVSGISPSSGPTAGGTIVTITGSGFVAADWQTTTVDFGNTAATDVQWITGGEITCRCPAEAAGSVDVTVSDPGGTSATSPADQFTYVAAPVVIGVTPNSGPTAGGTAVTISGSGFSGATAVDFGATAATGVQVVSDSEITCSQPAHSAGSVNVYVYTAGGGSAVSLADRFTYYATPVVGSITPAGGPLAGDTSVTINGSGFSGATAVDFGANPASSFGVISNSKITCTSPAGSGAVDVTVSNPLGSSATSSADQFTYTNAPLVSGVAPTAGPTAGGTAVTISGAGFGHATTVDFGANAATDVKVVSDSEITCTSPAGAAGTVDVHVTNPAATSATSAADKFTYCALPVVSGVDPNSGPTGGDTYVTITGSGFSGTTPTVKFGGRAASSDYEVQVVSTLRSPVAARPVRAPWTSP